MSTKNKVQLIGRLGNDPEVRTTEQGRKWVRLNVATNESYENAQGERVTDTQWHTVVAWGKLAETAGEMQKGSEVSVEGKLATRNYVDKGGQKRYITEVQAQILAPVEKEKAQA